MFITPSTQLRPPTSLRPESNVETAKSTPVTEEKGYNEDFLDVRLELPQVDAAYRDQIAPLKSDPSKSELEYTHFSVVMNKMRRMPMFTAVNIDGAQYNAQKRDGKWDFDPRMDSAYQLGNEAYSNNSFDKGHMVRRRDPMWGPNAHEASNDTFAYTNAALQHSSLNQHEWLDLENHILALARTTQSKMTVFTGPVLKESDPSFNNNGRMSKPAQIPTAFWKVMVWNDPQEGLKSESFLLSQEGQAKRQNSHSDTEEHVSDFTKYRIPLDQLETLTHLDFGNIIDSSTTRKPVPMPKEDQD